MCWSILIFVIKHNREYLSATCLLGQNRVEVASSEPGIISTSHPKRFPKPNHAVLVPKRDFGDV